MNQENWKEFADSGLLWFVNRQLHLFGWAIAIVKDDDTGEILDAYPTPVDFHGFSPESEERNFKKLTKYLKQNIDSLIQKLE